MKNLEEKLRRAVLVEATAKHEKKMGELFDAAAGVSGFVYRPVALWKCAAACVLCVGIGFVLSAGRTDGVVDPAAAAPPQAVTQPEPAPSRQQEKTRPVPEGRFVVGEMVTREDGWVEATVEIMQP